MVTDDDDSTRSPSERADGRQPPATNCRCGVSDVAPWRQRDTLWSPASFVAGVLTIAFLVLLATATAWALLAVGLALIVSFALSLRALHRAGHRSACLVARSVWRMIAAIGVPFRVAASLPF